MIGVIGQGFVGNAVYKKFKKFYEVFTYDLDKDKCNSTLEDIAFKCEIIFLCLPTPMNKNGSCNTSIVESTLSSLDLIVDNLETTRTVVLKSTVPPGTTERLNNLYRSLNIVFNPEFLTERNAEEDFKNQKRIILGGPRPYTTEVKTIFSKVFPKTHIIKTDSSHAEMIKYVTNTFLATKISFANEIFQLCSKLDIDYDKVIEYATLDDRLGKSHWGVPGHDGDLGYGGHCFPKDLAALLYLSYQYNTVNGVLKATQETNNKVRTDRDWERMKGRAVS